jgi:hypothetical protein
MRTFVSPSDRENIREFGIRVLMVQTTSGARRLCERVTVVKGFPCPVSLSVVPPGPVRFGALTSPAAGTFMIQAVTCFLPLIWRTHVDHPATGPDSQNAGAGEYHRSVYFHFDDFRRALDIQLKGVSASKVVVTLPQQ